MRKTGKKVWVCYDGKWSRRTEGVIIKYKKHKVLVKFNKYILEQTDKHCELWFKRRSRTKWDSWDVKAENSILRGFFGAPGDYYRLFKGIG